MQILRGFEHKNRLQETGKFEILSDGKRKDSAEKNFRDLRQTPERDNAGDKKGEKSGPAALRGHQKFIDPDKQDIKTGENAPLKNCHEGVLFVFKKWRRWY